MAESDLTLSDLPEELVDEILLKLDGFFLWEVCIYVCVKWKKVCYKTIRKIQDLATLKRACLEVNVLSLVRLGTNCFRLFDAQEKILVESKRKAPYKYLKWAGQSGNVKLVKLAMKKVCYWWNDVIEGACEVGSLEIIDYVLGLFSALDYSESLHRGVKIHSVVCSLSKGNFELYKTLTIERKWEDAVTHNTPLEVVCESKNVEMVKYILKRDGWRGAAKTALHNACFCDRLEIVRVLLQECDGTSLDLPYNYDMAKQNGEEITSLAIVELIKERMDHPERFRSTLTEEVDEVTD